MEPSTSRSVAPEEVRACGIAGTYYSGSTLLSFVLGGSSGVFVTNEANDVINRPSLAECRMCGKQCEFWSDEFISFCTEEKDYLYDRVRERAAKLFRSQLVLFADKDPLAYRRALEAGNRFDQFIILFKRPHAFAFSSMTHDKRTIHQALDNYAVVYERCFDFLSGFRIPYFTVFYEDFARDTRGVTKAICSKIGIEFRDDSLFFWKNRAKFHTLAGNLGTYAQLVETEDLDKELGREYWSKNYSEAHRRWFYKNYRRVAVDDKWKSQLTPEQIRRADSHKASGESFDRLMRERIF